MYNIYNSRFVVPQSNLTTKDAIYTHGCTCMYQCIPEFLPCQSYSASIAFLVTRNTQKALSVTCALIYIAEWRKTQKRGGGGGAKRS